MTPTYFPSISTNTITKLVLLHGFRKPSLLYLKFLYAPHIQAPLRSPLGFECSRCQMACLHKETCETGF